MHAQAHAHTTTHTRMAAAYDLVMESCREHGRDPGSAAFIAYDTCGPRSPVRNCAAGDALFAGVLRTFLRLDVSSVRVSQELRDALRADFLLPLV